MYDFTQVLMPEAKRSRHNFALPKGFQELPVSVCPRTGNLQKNSFQEYIAPTLETKQVTTGSNLLGCYIAWLLYIYTLHTKAIFCMSCS